MLTWFVLLTAANCRTTVSIAARAKSSSMATLRSCTQADKGIITLGCSYLTGSTSWVNLSWACMNKCWPCASWWTCWSQSSQLPVAVAERAHLQGQKGCGLSRATHIELRHLLYKVCQTYILWQGWKELRGLFPGMTVCMLLLSTPCCCSTAALVSH